MNAKKTKPTRPRMPPATQEMKEWSARLGEELLRWPQVKTRPMFGLRGFYRKAQIFAALPVTRAISTPNTLIFKIDPMPEELQRRAASDARVNDGRGPGHRWHSFEMRSAQDLRDVLWWLNQAYEWAKRGR
jgi:hypothetical protein